MTAMCSWRKCANVSAINIAGGRSCNVHQFVAQYGGGWLVSTVIIKYRGEALLTAAAWLAASMRRGVPSAAGYVCGGGAWRDGAVYSWRLKSGGISYCRHHLRRLVSGGMRRIGCG